MVHHLRTLAQRTPSGVLAGAVFVVCLLVYVPTVTTSYVNTDAGANSLAAWRFAHTGTPWMDGLDLREPGDVPHFARGRDGHMVTTRTPGQIWAASPFYLGSSADQRDWSHHRGGVAAAAMTAAAMALLFLGLVRAGAGRGWSLGGTAVVAFTTPVWSVSANALWTHPVTLLGICGAVWASSRERWWLTGVFLAAGMTGRMHVALIAAVLGLGLAWSRRSPGIAVRIAVPTLISLGLLSVWSRFVFGASDPRGAYANHPVSDMVPAAGGAWGYLVDLAGFLVAPDRGLLVWTPVLLVLLPAVARGWRTAPDWTRWLAVGGVAYSLAQVGLNVFHGGDVIYGYRLALELLVAVTPLCVTCAHLVGSTARALLPPLVGLQAGAFFLGSVLENISLPQTVVWQDNALWRAVTAHPTSLGLVFGIVALATALGTQAALGRAGSVSGPAGAPDAVTAGPRTEPGSRGTR